MTNEKKSDDDEQRESETRYRQLFETSLDGIAVTDLSGRYLECNRAYLDLLGYDTIDQLRLKSYEEVTPPEYHAFEAGVIETQTLARGWCDEYEKEYIRKTGERVAVSLRAWLRRNAQGQPSGMWAIVRDITGRKRAEEEIGMLKQSIDTYYDGAYWIDSNNKFIYINDVGCKALGYTHEELIGKTINEVSPKASADRMNEVWAGLRKGGSFSIETVHRRKDGSEFPVEVVTTYVRFGGKEYVCGIARDITNRKKTEKRLHQQRTQLEEAQRISHVGSWERDISTNIITLSGEMTRIFGVNPREQMFTLQMLLDLMHPDDREPFQKAVRKAVYEKNPYSIEYRIVRGDGSTRTIKANGEAQYDNTGKPLIFRGTAQDITERKRAEETLRENQNLLETVIEAAPSCIKMIAADGTLLRMNRAGLEMIEAESFDQVRGQCVYPLVSEAHREAFQSLVQDVFQGKSCALEFEMIGLKGRPCWLNTHAVPLLNDRGEIASILAVTIDITERKNAEKALGESEHKFRNLAEESPNMIFINKKGRVVFANKRCEDITGYSRDELYAPEFGFMKLIAPEHRDQIKMNLQRHMRGEEIQPYEYTLCTKSGELIESIITTKLIDFEGERAILGIITDITERRRVEEALRKDEEFIRNILNSVDEAFIVIDRDYRIVTANKAYCIFASCEDVIGKHCYETSHKSKIACYDAGEECAVRRVFETRRPHVSLHTHHDEDGRPVYVETKAFPIKDSTGNVISAIETINNITEKRLLEEERLKTEKLEAIGTLAGGIAHDFNNLLQGVFGYISLAKLSADQKEKSVAALEQAEKALHLSVNLTSQLLTFSKGGKPVKQRVDLRPVIENAARFALSGSRSDSLLTISNDLWAVDADSGQIGQVIQNIVLNADQAMPEGGHVEITASNVETPGSDLPQGLKDGRYMRISIKDNGVGIPEQYIAKIFDPYFTTKEKGSGLGLATSYSIVRNHDGLIDVQSQPGKGSTFVIYIPAAAPVTIQPVAAPVPRPARTGRILVMDDDDVVRNVAGELIRALGHSVDFAERGEAAVSKYKTARDAGRPYDIVILDLTVRGGMGGVQTIQKLRAIDPAVKAIVSSGYSDDAEAAEYQKSGFRSFLKKPYNVEELRTMLNALLP